MEDKGEGEGSLRLQMGEALACSRDVSTMQHWETGFTKIL